MHEEVDVLFGGRERAITCHRIDDVICDPGPSPCIDALIAGLPDGYAPRAILLTHIHLDHAGATGVLCRRWPDAEVWVHERGARHMADPSRLIAGATALYAERMEELWGEIVPVAQERLVVLAGGEVRDGFRVEYTPGHAKHHVAYFHEDSGIALCGDVAGIRITPEGRVLPPVPPPDIDLDVWPDSVDKVAAWGPSRLAVTHAGSYDDVDAHLAQLRETLRRFRDFSRSDDRAGFDALVSEIRDGDGRYLAALPADMLWVGVHGD
jgi:glyoxylase-like metal-dependent hydrolase (beta-lactamase superfamily II)